MYVKIIESHSLGGGKDVEKGDVLDLHPDVAAAKIRMKYAVPATEEEAAKAVKQLEKEQEKAAKSAASSGSGS